MRPGPLANYIEKSEERRELLFPSCYRDTEFWKYYHVFLTGGERTRDGKGERNTYTLLHHVV
jgi:hypothetical protein